MLALEGPECPVEKWCQMKEGTGCSLKQINSQINGGNYEGHVEITKKYQY